MSEQQPTEWTEEEWHYEQERQRCAAEAQVKYAPKDPRELKARSYSSTHNPPKP